ncbi:MAG: DUF2934 domain-containing protein [Gammaproteobacteria bacterium]
MATDNSKVKKASKVTKDKPGKETKKSPPKKPAVRAKSNRVSATAKPARSSAKPARSSAKPARSSAKPVNHASGEERIEMIRTAAYFISQQRGYHGNYELDDWIEAEREIDRQIS